MQYESVFSDIRALTLNDNTLNDLKFRCEWTNISLMFLYTYPSDYRVWPFIGLSLVKYYLCRKMNIRIIINYQLKYILSGLDLVQ